MTLSSEHRRHLYLIITEALTNARRHAQPTSVEVRVTLTRVGLRVEIKDDGATPANLTSLKNGGNGLRNMRARAAELDAWLTIEPCDARPGTCVILQTRLR